MQKIDHLNKIRRSEKAGRIARRLSMLIVLLVHGYTFTGAGRSFGCDRRTVSLWYRRYDGCRKSVRGIRGALSDLPRPGRPTKIGRDALGEAEKWCADRPFTPLELRDRLEEMSGVRLSMQQVRRYAARWGYSRKKAQPGMINRASMHSVRRWRRRLFKKVEAYRRRGYAVATMDESHFMDGVLSSRFWTRIGVRIVMLWSGGRHRFSMLCTMTMDGRAFFNHCGRVSEDVFLEHLELVYGEAGRMVLVLDKAPWHTSEKAKKFFRGHGIVVVWYPTGHPYLNPVEEVWGVLKRTVDGSIRYANKKEHLDAVYDFVNGGHELDYGFPAFWKRKPPKSLMRPFVRACSKPDSDTGKYCVD